MRAFRWPTDRFLLAWYAGRKWERIGNVRVVDCTQHPSGAAEFIRTTREALQLIDDLDPVRYRRLQAYFDWIVNREMAAAAGYEATLRACWVNFGSLFSPSNRDRGPSWRLASYAATLVHEATHARLFDLEFGYFGSARLRHERLCTLEAQRFSRRLPRNRFPFRDGLVRDFDHAKWQNHFTLRFVDHLRIVARQQEASRKRERFRKV